MNFLLLTFLVSVGLNLVLFLFAYRFKSDKLTDLSYALSFIVVTVFCLIRFPHVNSGLWIGAAMVLIWALRIGLFLFARIIGSGKDARFDGIREHFVSFGRFWVGQGISVWVLMLPLIFSFSHARPTLWWPLAVIGIVLWATGLIIESYADDQKRRFKADQRNTGKWIDTGLWRYARHPNYFGEMLIWVGVYVFTFSALTGLEKIVGLVSPLLIIILLRFISGVPPLENSADKKWGSDEAYKAYKKRTYLLIPLPRS